MAFIEQIYNLNLWYLPIIIFTLILLLGIGIGVWNGWKTSLFFLVWHLAIMIIAIFVGELLLNKYLNQLIDLFGLPAEGKDIILENSNTFIDICLLIVLIGSLLIIDFIAFWFYLIFRKKLKRSIKETRELGGSNKASRSVGGVIGFVSAMPMAIGATGFATTFTSNVNVGSAFSRIVKYGTFTKVDDIYDNTRSLLSMLLAIDPLNTVIKNFDDIDNTDINNIPEASAEEKANNTQIMEDILSFNTATALITNLVEDQLTQGLTLSPGNLQLAGDIFLTQFDPLTLDAGQEANLFTILDTIFPNQDEAVNNLIALISN